MLGVDDSDARPALGKMVGQRGTEDSGAGDDDVSHRVSFDCKLELLWMLK
jgi:hypothetical protein